MSQPTLRLTQTSEGDGRYCVEVALEEQGLPRQTAHSSFGFALSAEEQADLRWYLETYLQYPIEPAPTIAERIERRMEEIGVELFAKVFESSRDARRLWDRLYDRLNDMRVEIVSGVREAAAIPWELLRDPATGVPLALRAQAFVRAQPAAAQRPQLPAAASGPIRILLVICRPGGGDDVPFRSVASRLIKGLSGEAREAFQLDVLRPPTFEQLSRALRTARAAGAPYHVVHFDGHGVYTEGGAAGGPFNRNIYSDTRPGRHGYLAFENPALEDNQELVHGPALGALLVETGVPVLVLNACRSAHTDERPTTNDQRRTTDDGQGDKETGRQGDEEAEQSTIYNLQSPRATDNGPRTTHTQRFGRSGRWRRR